MVSHSGAETLSSFVNIPTNTATPVSVYTNSLSETSLALTFKVQNSFVMHDLVQSTFHWKSCQNEVPKINGYTGLDPAADPVPTMIDFTGLSSGGIPSPIESENLMLFDPWTFESGVQYCTNNKYKFVCTDPDGNKYAENSIHTKLSVETSITSTSCQKFDLSLLYQRQITGLASAFNQSDEGIYTIYFEGWMQLRGGLESQRTYI